MNPLDLIDDVVEEWWQSEIEEIANRSDYGCFIDRYHSHSITKLPKLIGSSEILSKRKHVFDYPEMPIESFFDYEEMFDDFKPLEEEAIVEGLEMEEPVWSALEKIYNTPKDIGWKEIVCNLGFFGQSTLREHNDDDSSFNMAFDSLCFDIADELKFPDKPLCEYTDDPITKIRQNITVDGVPLLQWLEC